MAPPGDVAVAPAEPQPAPPPRPAARRAGLRLGLALPLAIPPATRAPQPSPVAPDARPLAAPLAPVRPILLGPGALLVLPQVAVVRRRDVLEVVLLLPVVLLPWFGPPTGRGPGPTPPLHVSLGPSWRLGSASTLRRSGVLHTPSPTEDGPLPASPPRRPLYTPLPSRALASVGTPFRVSTLTGRGLSFSRERLTSPLLATTLRCSDGPSTYYSWALVIQVT